MSAFTLQLITLQKKRSKGWLKYLYRFECEKPEPRDLKALLKSHIDHFMKP